MEERIMTTLPSYPGYEVAEDLGIIWAYDHDFRPVRALALMDDGMNLALDSLWKKAVKKGANAVLGINMCFGAERSIPVLMGTAVILKKKD